MAEYSTVFPYNSLLSYLIQKDHLCFSAFWEEKKKNTLEISD